MKSLGLKILGMILGVSILIVIVLNFPNERIDERADIPVTVDEETKDGIHVPTGLKVAEHYKLVVANCTGCHSAKLVTQNRMSTNQWKTTIKWMQESQNLWDLGENEAKIISYLVTNYPYVDTGRRANLTSIEWYNLEK